MNIQYNFRLAPEAIWLIVNTVAGAVLVDIIGRLAGLEAFPTLDTIGAWGSAIAIAAIRTGLGALLAAATGGGFQRPGEPSPTTVEAARTGDPTPEMPGDLEAPFFPDEN
jgi:hypothetical protein